MTRLTLDQLTKVYDAGKLPAVCALTLDVEEGELLVLLGPSGCGKSTTLRLIAGLLMPTSGDIRFDGRSVLDLAPEKRGAVMVFQEHALFPFLTVGDNIAFGLKLQNLDRPTIQQRIDEALKSVQLDGHEKRWPDQLSGGQRQRVALARALAIRPNVLLLDEPFSNLEPDLRHELRAMVRNLVREAGITTLLVTHDQEEAAAIADRIALIFDGRLHQVGDPQSFYTAPLDRQICEFFGGVNFLAGQRDGSDVTTAIGQLHVCPQPVVNSAGNGDVLLTIRPEAIELRACETNTVTGIVQERGFLGKRLRLQVNVAGERLAVDASPYSTVQRGDQLALYLPPERITFLPKEA